MREIDLYNQQKEKLSGICDENNLTMSIQNKHPFLLTIKPAGGMDAQQTMMEDMDSGADTGYISSDASLVFAYRDGVLTYKTSETWTIGDALFNKIKNNFKKLHLYWLMHFFRDYHENGITRKVQEEVDAAASVDGVPPLEHEIDNIIQSLEPAIGGHDEDESDGDGDVDDEVLAEFYDDGDTEANDPATVSLSDLD